jgi:hypothetical protein
MYSKFDLSISDYFYNRELNKHLESGKKLYEKYELLAKKNLGEFIVANGHIDGTAMKSNWFQIEDVDIFISHSHNDITKVKAFAGWLYDKFNLVAFIDSCVWGYCDDLLKQIDNMYCKKKDGKTYDYDLRNYTTSHVHMMLSAALTEMIDNTECIMFYNTPSSITMVDDLNTIKNSKKKVTLSPWIYHELASTSFVRLCKPEREIPLFENVIMHKDFSERNNLNIEYDVDKYLENMVLITGCDLDLWRKTYEMLLHKIDGYSVPNISGFENIHPLDVLYNCVMMPKKN